MFGLKTFGCCFGENVLNSTEISVWLRTEISAETENSKPYQYQNFGIGRQ